MSARAFLGDGFALLFVSAFTLAACNGGSTSDDAMMSQAGEIEASAEARSELGVVGWTTRRTETTGSVEGYDRSHAVVVALRSRTVESEPTRTVIQYALQSGTNTARRTIELRTNQGRTGGELRSDGDSFRGYERMLELLARDLNRASASSPTRSALTATSFDALGGATLVPLDQLVDDNSKHLVCEPCQNKDDAFHATEAAFLKDCKATMEGFKANACSFWETLKDYAFVEQHCDDACERIVDDYYAKRDAMLACGEQNPGCYDNIE